MCHGHLMQCIEQSSGYFSRVHMEWCRFVTKYNSFILIFWLSVKYFVILVRASQLWIQMENSRLATWFPPSVRYVTWHELFVTLLCFSVEQVASKEMMTIHITFSGSRWCCDLSGWTKAWLWIWWLCHILRSTGTNKITAELLFFLPSFLPPFLASFRLSFSPCSVLFLLPSFYASWMVYNNCWNLFVRYISGHHKILNNPWKSFWIIKWRSSKAVARNLWWFIKRFSLGVNHNVIHYLTHKIKYLFSLLVGNDRIKSMWTKKNKSFR